VAPRARPGARRLPAAFRPLTAADSLLGGRSAVTAAGDSVVVVATGNVRVCGRLAVSAGVDGGALVVTNLISFPPEGIACLAVAYGPEPFRVVVHGVPGGHYTVIARERSQTQVGRAEFRERELARRSVTVP
jgi:hypothetical protein